MLHGLQHLRKVAPRHAREEYTRLIDPFIKEEFIQVCPPGIQESTENWSRSFYTIEGHKESILKFDKPLTSEPTDTDWLTVKAESFRYFE